VRCVDRAVAIWLAAACCGAAADAPDIQKLKSVEQSAGFKPTGNFTRVEPRITAYYRCYYTGKLELPESYNDLKLRQGTKDGCKLNEKKYDVFFYPIEAVASGHTPVTQSLAQATAGRLAMVVPHEDFHAQIEGLPDRVAEAAATLVGFLTGATAMGEAPLDADLFLRKAEMVNRTFDQLSAVYRSARRGSLSQRTARDEQGQLLGAFEQECAAIPQKPVSFNKCLSAPNNAGLAFDHTYTKFYPLLYGIYVGCGKDLRCTTQRILAAPRKRPEREVVAYLEGERAGTGPTR
jgi:hypothetical protein